MHWNNIRILGALIALAGCAGTTSGRPATDEGTISHIMIDRQVPAYTVVMGVPVDATPAQWSQVRRMKAKSSKVELIEWKAFFPEAEKRLAQYIIKDEYGMKGRLGDFLYAVQNYPGAPFGLTWNGGMAFTQLDYRHTEAMYAEYMSNPSGWRARGGRGARADPVNPDGHLPFFLVPREEQERLAGQQ